LTAIVLLTLKTQTLHSADDHQQLHKSLRRFCHLLRAWFHGQRTRRGNQRSGRVRCISSVVYTLCIL